MRRRASSYQEHWEAVYGPDRIPFDVEEPLPWVVTLAEDGRIRGRVLDAGCGGGHNALYLARRGYDVVGIDVAPTAISRARHKAGQRGVHAEFVVGDIPHLANWPGMFDTVIDIGCFHSLFPEDRARYASALHAACHEGALLHLRCFSDRSKWLAGPQMAGLSSSDLEQAFADGWVIEGLTAGVDAVFPEPHSWSGSWSTGRSDRVPDGRTEHQETRRENRAGHGPGGAQKQVFNSRSTEFWYATVARRP